MMPPNFYWSLIAIPLLKETEIKIGTPIPPPIKTNYSQKYRRPRLMFLSVLEAPLYQY